MDQKCIVKGCGNHRNQGLFVGTLCNPCYVILTEGRYLPGSYAWFAEESRRAPPADVVFGLKGYLEAWQKLPEVVGYTKPAFDEWLGRQLERLASQDRAPVSTPVGEDWEPIETAPRDGTPIDMWTVRNTRVSNVRWITAAMVNPKYAKGGDWEHLALDGWRHSTRDDGALVPEQFTHWRHITGPYGQKQNLD